MHGVFTRMMLHQLLEEAGGDRAEAARRAGVGRTTMYRWIKAGLLEQPLETIRARYGPRAPAATKLELHGDHRGAARRIPALERDALFAECRAAGYTGGITQLRDFVRTLRPAPEPVIRFETEPGHQAQVDFAHCRLPWGVRYALVVVLGYSRALGAVLSAPGSRDAAARSRGVLHRVGRRGPRSPLRSDAIGAHPR